MGRVLDGVYRDLRGSEELFRVRGRYCEPVASARVQSV